MSKLQSHLPYKFPNRPNKTLHEHERLSLIHDKVEIPQAVFISCMCLDCFVLSLNFKDLGQNLRAHYGSLLMVFNGLHSRVSISDNIAFNIRKLKAWELLCLQKPHSISAASIISNLIINEGINRTSFKVEGRFIKSLQSWKSTVEVITIFKDYNLSMRTHKWMVIRMTQSLVSTYSFESVILTYVWSFVFSFFFLLAYEIFTSKCLTDSGYI